MTTIIIDSTAVQTALSELARRTQHLQPVFNSISEDLENNIASGFRDEKSPDGTGWTPLKKPRKSGSSKILNDTGRLKDSFAHVASNSFVEITTDTMYAPFHQFGTRKMVARPFFPSATLPPAWEQDILDTLNHFLTTA